ncbi:unnamed protein product [Diamesa serratosioi]
MPIKNYTMGCAWDFWVAVVRTVGRFVGADVNAVSLIPMGLFIHPGTKGTISGWGVVLSMRGTTIHICGASIIATQWAVTSAKCLVSVSAFSAAPKCSLHVVPFSGRENYLSVVNYLVGSSDGIKNIELPVGIHKFSFSCSLSSHLPSSIETTKGFIRYSLEVSIDVPLGFKKEFKFPFTVIKPEDMNALPSALKKPLEVEVYKRFCSWKCISNPLKFIVKIPYSGFVPGEAVNVIVDVKNDSNNDVRKFKISLLKTIKYTSQTPKVKTKIVKETVMNVFENGIKRGTSGRIRKGFVISHVPSTNITYCTVIEISYELKIVGKISGLHFSPKVKIPIMIGTIPIVDHLILKKDTKTVATDPRNYQLKQII